MPIILRIRELLKLENKAASITTDLTDSIGLYLTEGMIRKREDNFSEGCFGNHTNTINVHHHCLLNSNSIDSTHYSHEIHF